MNDGPTNETIGAPRLAIVLEGGGARASWQVGALRGLLSELPELSPRIIVGISAGAINASSLANSVQPMPAAVEELAELWHVLDVERVFEAHPTSLMSRVLRVGLRVTFGLRARKNPILGMVNTNPLRETLSHGLGTGPSGSLDGVRANIASGQLDSLALLTTRYNTGQTICFFQGGEIGGWNRPNRRGIASNLTVEHVMASAALPLFFPPIQLKEDWYGDGGVRLIAPLAPAVHLGATKILALSTRYARTDSEADERKGKGPPSPALIAGNLFNAIFLDSLDQDAANLRRLNRLIENQCDPPGNLRTIDLALMRPSVDLGRLASRFEPELPWFFRRLLRNLGTKGADSQDLLSTVLFDPGYVSLLMELGEKDGRNNAPEVARSLGL
jgi:NTE family protein